MDKSPSLRLVIPALAAWAVALVLLGCSALTGATVGAAATTAALTLIIRTRRTSPGSTGSRRPPRWPRGWPAVALGTLGCVAATAVTVAFRAHAVGTGPVADAARKNGAVSAEIVLTDDPKVLTATGGTFRRERVILHATAEKIETGKGEFTVSVPIVVLASGDEWKRPLPSQRLAVHGRLAPADHGELLAAVLLARGPPRVLTPPSTIQQAAGVLRAGLRKAADVLPPDQRGLVPGLVAGDVSRMDPQVKADFYDAGLSHLTAVSGANLAIVAGAAMVLGRVAGLPLPVRAALSVVAMLAFAVVARPSPSVLRALLMGVVAALALGSGRQRDGVAALSVTVLGLILFDPALARSFGFALSVCATAGILLLAPRWRDRLATRLPRWLSEAVAIPAAAQAAVTPVLVLMVGELSPVAVPANLLAGPAVAPATLLGFAAALIAPIHLGAAQLVVRPAGWAAGWIISVAEEAAALPSGTVPWPGGIPGLVLLAVSVAVAMALCRHPLGRRAMIATACGACVAVLAIGPVVSAWPPGRWLLVACDVGQGDALVIAAGPGRGVVVDAGSDEVRVNRCLRDLGVREVPLVVLTHPHFDHVGGLAGIFRGRPVAAVASAPQREPQEASRRLSADIARRGVPEVPASPGTRWTFGPSEVTVLAPPGDTLPNGPSEGAKVNNASVVLHVRWTSGSALLSGDIETEAQTDLLRQGFPRADILKVPHHGSIRQDPEFLSATGARAALISVGSDNDYGHPALPTITHLTWNGMRVYRTDHSGDLAVIDHHGHLAILPRGTTDPD